MIKTEAYSTSRGELIIPYIDQYVEPLCVLQGKKLQITVEEYVEDVTPNQHGYYRALNRWLSEETLTFGGQHPNDIHDIARGLFLYRDVSYVIAKPDGEKLTFERKDLISTSGIGKKRMADFITKWRDWLLYELNIDTPEAEYFKLKPVILPTNGPTIDDKIR